MRRPEGALKALDGFRAIAIMLVVARHGIRPLWVTGEGFAPIGSWDLGIPAINGWGGVDMFFVLSGFLITIHITKRYPDGIDRPAFRNYAYRRAMRIFPAYAATIGIVVLGLIPGYSIAREGLGFRVLYHLLFLQDYLPSDLVVVFWTLGVEEKFYLIAPFVLMALRRVDSAGTQYAIIAGLALIPIGLRIANSAQGVSDVSYIAFFTDVRSPAHLTYDGLAVGMLCGLLYQQRNRVTSEQLRVIGHAAFTGGLLIFGGLLFGWPLLDEVGTFDRTVLQAILAWSAGAMLLGLVFGGGPVRLLSASWLFVVSRLSYSWYLMHLLVVPLSIQLSGVTPDSGIDTVATYASIYLASSLLLAVCLHYAVEVPFLMWRDRHRTPPTPADSSIPTPAEAR